MMFLATLLYMLLHVSSVLASRKWQYNCQDKGYSALEVEAWDTYFQLAKYAQLWKANGAYQSTADLWFGKDSNKSYTRIMSTFNHLVEWHDTHWTSPNPSPGNALTEVWCAFDGPDGHPPVPDDPLLPGETWDASICLPKPGKPGSGQAALSYKLSRWWWPDETRYYTIICPRSWEQRQTLDWVNTAISDMGGKEKVDMNFLWDKLRAQTWLHEFTHHDIISNPNQPIVDVLIKGSNWPISYDRCYGADAGAALAKWFGSTTPVKDSDGGYNGEFGTAINADAYAMFAMSVYFQETLSRQAPIEPADPRYKNIPRSFVEPVPNHPGQFNSSYSTDDSADMYSLSTSAPVTTATTPSSPTLLSIKDKALCINESTPNPFQIPFTRNDAIANIASFCNNKDFLDFQVVPPIGWGNGKTKSGQNKGMQFDNSISSANNTVANGIWLNVRFFNEECTGSVNFAQGNDTAAKAEYCTNNFMSILDGCQTDTRQAKYGGALQTNCLYYQIQGRTPNTTENYKLANPGPLICNPTDAAILPSLAGTCTCSYANYIATDTFIMPASKNCSDVDSTSLYSP